MTQVIGYTSLTLFTEAWREHDKVCSLPTVVTWYVEYRHDRTHASFHSDISASFST